MRGRQAQPPQAGGGKHDGIPALGLELAQARVDVAADGLDRRGPAAPRGAARAGAGSTCRYRARRGSVATGPGRRPTSTSRASSRRGNAAEPQPGGGLGRQVLEAVHGQIDLARAAAPPRSPARTAPCRRVRPAAHRRGDRPPYGSARSRPRRRRAQGVSHARGPGPERARCRACPARITRAVPAPKSSWTSSSQERLAPAREDSRSLVMGACRILLTIALDSASTAARVSGEASGSRASVLAAPRRCRISSSRSRSETIVGITSTSRCRVRNLATSRSTSASARWASRAALAQVGVDHLLEVVDVVAIDVVERVDAGLDVAGHGDVDEEQRPAAPRRASTRLTVAPGDHRLAGPGRGDHDVHGGQRRRQLVPRHRGPRQRAGQLLGPGPRAVGDVDRERALLDEVRGGQLAHLAGADQQHGLAARGRRRSSWPARPRRTTPRPRGARSRSPCARAWPR